jgi:hypothetical protein
VIRLVAAIVAVAVSMAACGGDDDDGRGAALRPQLETIAPAIEAVEAELGGPQEYFEITAEPQRVQLYVARADATQVAPYVFVGGELAAAGDAASASGGTFGVDALDFDADTVLDGLDAALDSPDVIGFSVAGNDQGHVQYQAIVRSEQGGLLDVVLAADGAVQSVTARG